LLLDRGGGGGYGALVLGPQPADESALLLGGAFVVQGGEAGGEFLFEGFGMEAGHSFHEKGFK